ncbi:MAG TPA: N-acetylmuramoyl-L-alanine amidase [Candidatus Angelobacter sp.]|nr:N-acetylmuramoyl-L-alanine amidase [Candidatus Angelobacter sp.]
MEPGNRILTRTLYPITRSTGACLGRRTLITASLACMLLALAPASYGARTVKEKKQAASVQFNVAERLRESLNGKPESKRSRDDYQRVMDAYRKVYHTAPNSNKADASVLAVAELLDEQGRVLDDPKSFKDAIGQLEFLRREYPGSKFRGEALFTIAQIYRDDLDDSAQAKTTFQDFLKHYPNSPMAARAHDEIDDIDTQAQKEQIGKGKTLKADAKAKPSAEEKPAPPAATNDRHHPPLLTSIRHWSTPDYTRVAIDLEQEVTYEAGRVPHPDRIFFDLHGAKVASSLVGKSFAVDDGFLHKIRVAQYKANLARVVLDVDDVAEYSAFLLPNPYRLIIDIHGRKTAAKVSVKHSTPLGKSNGKPEVTDTTEENPSVTAASTANHEPAQEKPAIQKTTELAKAEEPKLEDSKIDEKEKATSKPTTGPTFQAVAPKQPDPSRTRLKTKAIDQATHVASPTSSGERSLIRALGLKIGKIVIDAGHGGHDTGTIGPNGLMEKDLVLDVALKLGKLLEDRMGAEVIYTRDDDTFIPLETRTAIANKEQADLFISIHANSSSDSTARGIETYYLNFTSSADALEVAARENAVSEKSIHELQDLVKKIALKEKIGESREFALDVQKSLYSGLLLKSPGLHDRGVKKAPFIVLIGANMPSILAEISFVSNPTDEKKLKTGEYRQRVAESLYKGISKYVSGLSGVKVASRLEDAEHSALSSQHPAPVHAGESQ